MAPFYVLVVSRGGLERADCAPALVGVDVVGRAGRCTLTPSAGRRRGAPGVPRLLDAGAPGPGGRDPSRRGGQPGPHTRRRHPLGDGQDQTFVAWGIARPARRMPSGPMVLGRSEARATAPIAHARLRRAARGSGRLSAARSLGRPLTAVVMTINRSPARHRTGWRTPRTAPTRLPAYEVPSVTPVSHRRPALYTPHGVAASLTPRGGPGRSRPGCGGSPMPARRPLPARPRL
jgi:hypothetical protein